MTKVQVCVMTKVQVCVGDTDLSLFFCCSRSSLLFTSRQRHSYTLPSAAETLPKQSVLYAFILPFVPFVPHRPPSSPIAAFKPGPCDSINLAAAPVTSSRSQLQI
uniref:Uncharacterized protein n=1 Tax=Knipowitschia caucasica TaxID=637954 RepID=A0AAV2JPS2_KNICA